MRCASPRFRLLFLHGKMRTGPVLVSMSLCGTFLQARAPLKAVVSGGPDADAPTPTPDWLFHLPGNDSWHGLVYGAHPRTLLRASPLGIAMLDLRASAAPATLFAVMEHYGIASMLGAAGRLGYVPGTHVPKGSDHPQRLYRSVSLSVAGHRCCTSRLSAS